METTSRGRAYRDALRVARMPEELVNAARGEPCWCYVPTRPPLWWRTSHDGQRDDVGAFDWKHRLRFALARSRQTSARPTENTQRTRER